MKTRILHITFLLGLLVLPLILSQPATGLTTNPLFLATYQTAGPPIQMYYEIINNTSFETGTSPWTLVAYNNYTPGLSLASPGYNDNSAVQLNINSGNLTIDSHITLLQDLSRNTVAFATGLRLRAAGQVKTLTGNSITDRVEILLTLSNSIGNQARIHYVLASGTPLPTNSTADGYIAVPGFGSSLWIVLDRNVTSDAASTFPTMSGSLSTVKDVRLTVFSTSVGTPTNDPRIKYYETGTDSYWNKTETVVYDPDADGLFNPATDWILYNRGIPPTNQPLNNDPRIKYVDTNLNGHWDPGKPIVYDLYNEGVYDAALNDPVINGTAIPGSLLQTPIRKQTTALFDQVELYSPTGNINWAHNGGFETGDLTGWGNTAGFRVATSPTRSGYYSVNGTSTGTSAALAQSIDGRPAIDTTTSLQASAYIGKLTGTSPTDKADIWLGLVDSSPQANPLSVYYYFNTGTTIPSNTTDTINRKAPGYGTLGRWLNVTQSLLPETQYFDATGHTGPYRIEALVLEASAQNGQSTIAYFDDISILSLNHPIYSTGNGYNSTYTYTANNPPQGSFYFNIPGKQSVLNITTANGTPLQTSEYTTQPIQSSLQITIPPATGTKYPSPGNWHIYTSSKNALAYLSATIPGSTSSSTSAGSGPSMSTGFSAGSKVNFASQTTDPTGLPISGSNVTLIFNSSTNQVFTGKTDSQGWYNQTNIALPQNAGTDALEAITVSSSYIGLRTIIIPVNSTFPWATIAYISIAGIALILFGLFYLRSRRRKRQALATTPPRPPPSKTNTPSQRRPTKTG